MLQVFSKYPSPVVGQVIDNCLCLQDFSYYPTPVMGRWLISDCCLQALRNHPTPILGQVFGMCSCLPSLEQLCNPSIPIWSCVAGLVQLSGNIGQTRAITQWPMFTPTHKEVSRPCPEVLAFVLNYTISQIRRQSQYVNRNANMNLRHQSHRVNAMSPRHMQKQSLHIG